MSWAKLPGKLKIYIILLTSLATPVAIWTAVELVTQSYYDNSWLIIASLAILTVPFGLLLPSANVTVSIGDAFIMAIGMMYGVAPCIAATFCHTLLTSILKQRPKIYIYRIVFNIACTISVAGLYSCVYHKMKGTSSQIPDIIFSAAALVATFFITNSTLTSVAIAWSLKKGIIKFWANTCMPLAVDFSVSAVAATFIVVMRSVNEYMPLAAAPLVGLVWGYNKLNQIRIKEAEKHLVEQEQLYLRTVESLALAVDAKDQTTYGHIRRVKVYAMGLAKLCGVKDSDELKAIETGSLLHDIGKLAINDYILNKPGRLTKQEFKKVKIHAAAGDEILQQVHFPFPVAKYVRCHHERWDGLGYPDGLKGEDIPLGARILAIADSFDAIRFSRPYKLSVATDEAVEILRDQAGTAYDPDLIRLFIDNIHELEQTAIQESGNVPELSYRKYFETVDYELSISAINPGIPRDIPTELIQLAEFCNSVSGYFSLKELLPIFSKRMERIVPFSTCAIYLKNGDDRLHAECISGQFSDLLENHHMEMGVGISGWVAAYKRPMINTEPALDFQGISGDFSSYSDTLAVPIIHENESLGTVSLYAKSPISYSQYDLSILQILSGLLAPLIVESRKHATAASEDMIDPTTQIRRIPYLTAIGPQLISLANKNRSPLSLIYLEISNLSQITRIFGGNAGNSLLRKIADCIKPELRETDILVRYGNHGFVAFLPGVRDEQALRCVQRLKQQIRNEGPTTGQGLSVVCKAGVSSFPKDGNTVIALFQSAQENMQSTSQEPTTAQDGNVIDFLPRA